MDAPLRPAGRIASLDILRGLALLGMLVVPFSRALDRPGRHRRCGADAVWRLVESKSHGTFALLFGTGFAILLRHAEARGRPFAAFYLRRLAVLALFGFAAHALFGFNVLLGYAVWGVPLLLMRPVVHAGADRDGGALRNHAGDVHFVSEQRLMRAGGPAAVEAEYAGPARRGRRRQRRDRRRGAAGELRVLLAARLAQMRWFHRQPFFFLPGATLTLCIVGLLLVRHGVFEDPLAHWRVLAFMVVFGLVSWLVSNWLVPGSPCCSGTSG